MDVFAPFPYSPDFLIPRANRNIRHTVQVPKGSLIWPHFLAHSLMAKYSMCSGKANKKKKDVKKQPQQKEANHHQAHQNEMYALCTCKIFHHDKFCLNKYSDGGLVAERVPVSDGVQVPNDKTSTKGVQIYIITYGHRVHTLSQGSANRRVTIHVLGITPP
jgi:hypothetical protein